MANIIRDGSYVLSKRSDELKDFEEDLEAAHLVGEWQVPRRPEPEPGGIPYIWKWNMMLNMMRQSCEVLGLEEGGRRSILFVNPEIPTKGTNLSMRVGLQMLKPQDNAWAHRHTMSALRFIVKGNTKAFTVVNGEKFIMEDNDLILTPQGAWHHHENPSDDYAIWLDAIDTPFVKNVNAIFYEQSKNMKQEMISDTESTELQLGWARPQDSTIESKYGLPIVYKWGQTYEMLKRLATKNVSSYDGVILQYVNPMTGGAALPTIDCHIQMLRSGEQTQEHRHTSGTIYFVVQGEGTTDVGGKIINWSQGDGFIVPNWSWHWHKNLLKEEALLFSVSDAPILKAVQLYREEGKQ